MREGLVALASGGLVLALLGGCHANLPKLVDEGRYAEAVRSVEGSRFEARRKAARAYARALVQQGRYEAARTVLLRDFRRGRQLESLVALAELEQADGRLGMAALHYGRVMSLDARRLDGDSSVCALFRDRARAHLVQGEPIAADQDLRRVFETCGVPSEAGPRARDLELARRIQPQAQARARALRALPPVDPGAGGPTGEDPWSDYARALEAARAKGPAALAAFADRWSLELEAEEVLEVLLDEFDRPSSGRLYADAQLEGWLGRARRVDKLAAIAERVAELSPSQAAWITLRLRRFAPEVEGAPSSETLGIAAMHAGESDLADDVRAERGWKVLALAGDFAAAELVLRRALRPPATQPTAQPTTGGPSPESSPASGTAKGATRAEAAGVGASGSSLRGPWWEAIEPSLPGARGRLLAVARLRDAQGKALDALRIRAHALREAPDSLRRGLAREMLAAGRPWSALALVDGAHAPVSEPVELAATSLLELAVLLETIDGQGAELGSALEADRARARRVMGNDWSRLTRAEAPPLPARPQGVDARCPGTVSLFGDAAMVEPAGASWPKGPSDLADPELGERMLRALESEPTLGCGARTWVELLDAGLRRPTLSALRERMAFAPIERSAGTLETRALVALAVGFEEDATRLIRAAAGESADPRSLWMRAAQDGYARGARDYELFARSQALRLTPADAADPLQRGITRIRMVDATREYLLREGHPASIGAFVAHLRDYVDAAPSRLRAAREAALWAEFEALELEPALDERARELLEMALPPARSPLPAGAEAALWGPLAPETAELGRLARLVTGDAAERIAAARELLAATLDGPEASEARAALLARFERGGAALAPGAEVASSWFPAPSVVFRLAFELPIDPAVYLRPAVGPGEDWQGDKGASVRP